MYNLPEEARDHLKMRAAECLDEGSSIADKIRLARALYSSWGEQLQGEPHIHDLSKKLEKSIKTSREAMQALGLIEICKRCDEEEGGSCCGAGLENKFDTFLLLMNCLMGVSLPEHHRRADSCYFLSDTGCMLQVRLVLCVDFLCPKILGALSHAELIELQKISGDELVTGFLLYDAVKKLMRQSARTNLD